MFGSFTAPFNWSVRLPSVGENMNFEFAENCELWFYSKNFPHRPYAPAQRSCQNFACGKFL